MSAWYIIGLQSKAEDKKEFDVPWYERSFAVANNTEPAGMFDISSIPDYNWEPIDSSSILICLLFSNELQKLKL